ncbi:MAG: hypothetical protein AAB037_07215 [Chloroflexota bacterium]
MVSMYDVALALGEEFFSHRVRELCGANNLSFFLVEPVWLQDFLEKLQRGDVGVGVLIDMSSDPYDPANLYYRLAREVKASGGYVIDDPDRSPLTTHKARFHAILLKNGVSVPETIVIRREDIATFHISEDMRARIGSPFVVKPGWGYGSRGVIMDATSEADILKSAEQVADSDTFLLQKKLVSQTLDGRPAWFRVFYVCGEIIPCWWHPVTSDYRIVSPLERRTFGLVAVEQMVFRIAQLARMEFFSTEIALTAEGQFVAVDYLNDECDVRPKSYWPSGPPDELVRRIAWLMINKAITVIHKHPFENDLLERDRAWHPGGQ